jgi:dihydroneopterin aldolase
MRERKIFIHNLELSASIGVYENEKKKINRKSLLT